MVAAERKSKQLTFGQWLVVTAEPIRYGTGSHSRGRCTGCSIAVFSQSPMTTRFSLPEIGYQRTLTVCSISRATSSYQTSRRPGLILSSFDITAKKSSRAPLDLRLTND